MGACTIVAKYLNMTAVYSQISTMQDAKVLSQRTKCANETKLSPLGEKTANINVHKTETPCCTTFAFVNFVHLYVVHYASM